MAISKYPIFFLLVVLVTGCASQSRGPQVTGVWPGPESSVGPGGDMRVRPFSEVSDVRGPNARRAELAGQDSGPPVVSPPETTRRVPARSYGLPANVRVPGMKFMRSPYAPDAGLIDVTDLGRGIEVKCPYTGKIVLVP